MKRFITLAVVMAAGFLGYRYYNRSYAPVKQYEQFAEEILHRRYDAAADLTDGITAKALAGQGSQERIGGGPPMFQKLSRRVLRSNHPRSTAMEW